MEVETAVRAGAPVITIVAVDSGWGMERAAHRFKGIDEARYQGTDISPDVRYDLMAEAMGAHGAYVTAMDEFVPALEAAVASGKPAVIHVRVDGELNTNAIGYEQFQYSRTL